MMGCDSDEISHYILLSFVCVHVCVCSFAFFYNKLFCCEHLLLRLKCHGNDKCLLFINISKELKKFLSFYF